MRLQTVWAGIFLVAMGCQSADGEPETTRVGTDAANAVLSGADCPDPGDKAFFFWMEPRSAEPGDKIALFPYWTDMPGGYNDDPAGCLGGLKVHPEGAATFERQEDGLAIATISADAEPGTRVLLSADYLGHGLVGPVEIYLQDANPLVGIWQQDAADCPAESAVRELVFSGGNEMTVTWTPFEVYKDYWADYTYDPETGAFSFEVDGGNQVPGDMVTSGTARIEGDTLVFEGVFLGTPTQAEGGCRNSFKR